MSLPPYTYECRDAAPGYQKRWVRNAVDIFNADPRDRLISVAEKQRILGELSRELTKSECFVSDNKNFLIYHALLRQGLQTPNTPLWKEPVILAHEKPLRYLQQCALKQVTAQDEELKRLLPTPPFEKPRNKPSITTRCKSAWVPSAAAETDTGDEEQMKMHWGSEDLGVLDKWLDEADDEFFIDFSFIAWIGVVTKSSTMLDPISGLFIGSAALMLAFYGPYVYWISHGPTLDEWRERELAADRRRLREVIREENRAADAAMLRQLTERSAELKARKDMRMEKANGKDQSEKKTA
ncbi:hypothetical protein LZ31DRAFT_593064 [Colletotrichum somersetense]|nr:hypothetical protein LZ31DRAFT_593064 [Colletotrichum somersetense]